MIALSDCVVASTPYEFDDLIDHYRASPERLCVSEPGIDHDLFNPGRRGDARRRIGVGDEPLILFVGRSKHSRGSTLPSTCSITSRRRSPPGSAHPH